MKKALLKFPSGHRFITEGGLSIEFNGYPPDEEIDLSDADEEEFQTIRNNPHNNKLIKKVKDRIDKKVKIN